MPASEHVTYARSLLALVLAASCRAQDEVRVVAAEPPPFEDGARFATRELFATPRASFHVTRVAGSLAAHYHAHHEETVYVLSGTARMRIGDETFEIAAGSVVHVPEGIVHSVDVATEAVVLSVFAPPFDGVDRIFVER